MVKWEPVTGVLPPLNQEQWKEVFELYQQFPQYELRNSGMSLEGFKSIFWWEYAHRVLGRLIGFIFFIPLVFFLVTGRLPKSLAPKLLLMFALGGLQGLLGWYMVKSGLVQDPRVSQYRLAAHLGLALVIYLYMFWVALDLLYPAGADSRTDDRPSHGIFAASITLLVFLTAISGAFVAGTHAGFAFNTFPTMAGQWIPDTLFAYDPTWRNFFENLTTVQFDHRILATLLFVLILVFWWLNRHISSPPRLRIAIHLLLAVACLQVTLGISTLLLVVPTPLGAAHQGGALLLLTVSLFVLHEIRSHRRGTATAPPVESTA